MRSRSLIAAQHLDRRIMLGPLALAGGILWSNLALGAADCLIQSETVAKSTGVVEAQRALDVSVKPLFQRHRKCIAELEVKVAGKWLTAKGSHVFGPSTSEDDACEMAVAKAKLAALQKNSAETLHNTTNLDCRDEREADAASPPPHFRQFLSPPGWPKKRNYR